MSAKWVADIKGDRGSAVFEICVTREDNLHGLDSYGWFSDRKLLITHNGGACRVALVDFVWDVQVAIAHRVANALNSQDIRLQESSLELKQRLTLF